MVDTRNDDIVARYFDEVQNEIKRLISEDKDIKSNQVDTFNKEIFNQPDDIKSQIHDYIQKASNNNLDIKQIAKIIYDRFKLQVKNNVFDQVDKHDIPNPLLGERKHIMTYEKFSSPIYYRHDETKMHEIDENTIKVEGKNGIWYVMFYFDNKHRLDYIDNKWNVSIPEWYGFDVSFIEIENFFTKRYPKCKVYKVLEKESEKYNL